MLRERPALLPALPGKPEPEFEVYRFDEERGESVWMIAWASELTEAEIADLSDEERDLVQASRAVDDPAVGAVHNGEPRLETLVECLAATAAE
jgi:hypothetical protein